MCGSDSMDWDPSKPKSESGEEKGTLSHWPKVPDPDQKDRMSCLFPGTNGSSSSTSDGRVVLPIFGFFRSVIPSSHLRGSRRRSLLE